MTRAALIAAAVTVACRGTAEPPAARPPPQTIRCAVIGGMTETGFWPELAARYERLTGNKVEVVATGPKPVVVAAFRKGGVDLITVHACDAMVNLVADGLAVDPRPWLRNDLVIVGPADDPAHIRGEPDAVVALGRIASSKAKLLVHASSGADAVLEDLVEAGHVALPAESLVAFAGDNHDVLARAAHDHAYVIVGRIPFGTGKLKQDGIELMVRGDPRLRRPYLVEVAAGPPDDPRLIAARDFAAYLRQPETQRWIATFGKGRLDDQSLFFPVEVPR